MLKTPAYEVVLKQKRIFVNKRLLSTYDDVPRPEILAVDQARLRHGSIMQNTPTDWFYTSSMIAIGASSTT